MRRSRRLSPKKRSPKRPNSQENALNYEKRKANDRGGRHIGGSGQPDYKRGKKEGEVKNWTRPMSKYDVRKESLKGRNEITSKSGFTQGAINYIKRYRKNVTLYHGNKKIN